MFINQIRLSKRAKDQLARLKGRTGIKNWNVLCRWAFCYSLIQTAAPAEEKIKEFSNVEMSWHTFAGEYGFLYEALLKDWCQTRGLPVDKNSLRKYFLLHLERGINFLSKTGFITNIEDLVSLPLKGDD